MWNPLKTLFWSVNVKAKVAVLSTILAITAILGGMSAPYLHPQTRVVHVYHGVEIESPIEDQPGVADSMELWRTEIARRFPDAFAYFVHGGDYFGSWVCQDPDNLHDMIFVRNLAQKLQARFPGRVIVLIVCNPGGYDLHIPGVYHAKDSVWFVPDKDANNTNPGRQAQRLVVGNIYEFIDT